MIGWSGVGLVPLVRALPRLPTFVREYPQESQSSIDLIQAVMRAVVCVLRVRTWQYNRRFEHCRLDFGMIDPSWSVGAVDTCNDIFRRALSFWCRRGENNAHFFLGEETHPLQSTHDKPHCTGCAVRWLFAFTSSYILVLRHR